MIRSGHMMNLNFFLKQRMNLNFSSAPTPIHNSLKSRVEQYTVEYIYEYI